MADRFDLDAIEADDALLDLLAAGGETAWAAAEHDPALMLLADLRLAPGMQVDATFEAIMQHLARRGFGDIRVSMDSGYPAARTPLDAPVIQALAGTYRAHGFEPVIRPV